MRSSRVGVVVVIGLLFVGCSKETNINVAGDPNTGEARAPIKCTAPAAPAPSKDNRPMTLAPLADGHCYWIDTFEVTQSAYDAFLAASPATSSQPADCSWNDDFTQTACFKENGVVGPSNGDVPASCVDHCDAVAFCAWAGKRLCKGNGTSAASDAYKSEWYAACADPAAERSYPYAGAYDAKACTAGATEAGAVGSKPTCKTPDGAADLSGNVAEWTEECAGTSRSDQCLTRGGSFASDGNALRCDVAAPAPRDRRAPTIGFRCCADAK